METGNGNQEPKSSGRPARALRSVGQTLIRLIISHPWAIIAAWVLLTISVVGLAPNLTELAAEGQAHLVPEDSESVLAGQLVDRAWPEQAYQSVAVALLQRPGGLTEADQAYARSLATLLEGPDRPKPVLRVLGPDSAPEIAQYLLTNDRASQILIAQLDTSFVAPASGEAVKALKKLQDGLPAPPGLKLTWTGDAVFGSDYMVNVQKSLDREAVATVLLLLVVLYVVYRSFVLALVPMTTIGLGLLISRGLLAWMTQAGWPMSPLVELFLVVILFGCGTDFCLFLSWRFGEVWNPSSPERAMKITLQRAVVPLLTSAGTVIAGLMLMGLTQFKLFSATGPSVALGLALTLLATLTLTPSLLILLSRYYPRAFTGLTAPSSGFWDGVGRWVLARPFKVWFGTLTLMIGPALVGMSTWYIMDLVAEMPDDLPSVQGMEELSQQYGAGRVAPLTVVIRSGTNLRTSEGLALIDDVSRYLARQRRLLEVRSATRPLGSAEPLEPARLASRLGAVVEGFDRMIDGATQLQNGLNEGAARIRTAIMIEELTGLPLTGTPSAPSSSSTTAKAPPPSTRETLLSGLRQASDALLGSSSKIENDKPKADEDKPPAAPQNPLEGARELLLKELTLAADGASQIAEGATRAQGEITAMLADPVGRRALDRLLINKETVRDNPELLKSFQAYISPDGHLARFDLVQADRLCSPAALDQVDELRLQLRSWLKEVKDFGPPSPGVMITGPNAESADVRSVTNADQVQSWIVMPIAVFFVLLIALRDPLACANLVGTMILTYAFSLGITHAVFVWGLGADGLDWKVPYFLFVLLVAVGVDYNVFLMTRLQEEAKALGLRAGIIRAVAQTGGLISSAAAITACSFAAFMLSPLSSIRQLGFALVVGIFTDAALVRPVLVPCGQWLMKRGSERRRHGKTNHDKSSATATAATTASLSHGSMARVSD